MDEKLATIEYYLNLLDGKLDNKGLSGKEEKVLERLYEIKENYLN